LLGWDFKSIKACFWANRQDFPDFTGFYREITRNYKKLQEMTKNDAGSHEATGGCEYWQILRSNECGLKYWCERYEKV